LRIGIIGIGGVGGYFGGKLVREYEGSEQHEIIFIARGEHLKAIQKNGLRLFTKEGDYIARPKIALIIPSRWTFSVWSFSAQKVIHWRVPRNNSTPVSIKARL